MSCIIREISLRCHVEKVQLEEVGLEKYVVNHYLRFKITDDKLVEV